MNRIHVLFPGGFMNYRTIDNGMEEEYEAAVNTGCFNVILFNYDEWLAGDRLKLSTVDDISGKVVYRGWMLKPEEYSRLYTQLEAKGVELMTSPAEYSNMHLFPNVYPYIKPDTAGMMVFKNGQVDVEKVKKHFSRFMVKDSVKSVKGTEFPAFFDQNITQSEFDEWMRVFYKYRGDLLTGDICIKEYMDLKKYGDKTNEIRVFYINHQIHSIAHNSMQSNDAPLPPNKLIEKYQGLNSPYYTVDFAERKDEEWTIIEAGDGGVSGLSPGQDVQAYYRALYYALKNEE